MRSQVPLQALLQTQPELSSYLLDPIDTTPVSFDPSKGVKPFTERLDEVHHSWKDESLAGDHPFLREQCAQKVFGDITPIEYVADHPLKSLAEMNKKQLIRIIDFLGLRDLARELSQVIRADVIKALESALTKEKLSFVKHVMHEGEPIRFAPLHLENWDGDAKKLWNALHVRGINRLAKALYGADPALLWHIMRKLDTGRAHLLEKHCTDPKNRAAHNVLIKQVQEAI